MSETSTATSSSSDSFVEIQRVFKEELQCMGKEAIEFLSALQRTNRLGNLQEIELPEEDKQCLFPGAKQHMKKIPNEYVEQFYRHIGARFCKNAPNFGMELDDKSKKQAAHVFPVWMMTNLLNTS